jgi:hypothetical protein
MSGIGAPLPESFSSLFFNGFSRASRLCLIALGDFKMRVIRG